MISKACKYGIRATVFIASKAQAKTKTGFKEIAREIDAPEAFTAKILQSLNKNGIITSTKGPYGGFYCNEDQLQLPALKIVEVIDGLAFFKACGLGLKECSDSRPCPLHYTYARTRDQLLKTFTETSIEQLAKNLQDGNAYVNNT